MPGLGVEPGRRLVDEDQLGPPDHRHRQSEALLLAAGQTAVRRPAARPEPQPLAEGVDVEWMGVQRGDVPEHLHRVHPAPRAALLQHHADAGEQLPPLRDGVEAQDAHGAGLRPSVALAGLQRGRLPGAVGPEHGRDGAALDDQVETVDGDHVAVGHPESADLDSRRRGSGHPASLGRRRRWRRSGPVRRRDRDLRTVRLRCRRAPRHPPARRRRRPAARARGRAPAR